MSSRGSDVARDVGVLPEAKERGPPPAQQEDSPWPWDGSGTTSAGWAPSGGNEQQVLCRACWQMTTPRRAALRMHALCTIQGKRRSGPIYCCSVPPCGGPQTTLRAIEANPISVTWSSGVSHLRAGRVVTWYMAGTEVTLAVIRICFSRREHVRMNYHQHGAMTSVQAFL